LVGIGDLGQDGTEIANLRQRLSVRQVINMHSLKLFSRPAVGFAIAWLLLIFPTQSDSGCEDDDDYGEVLGSYRGVEARSNASCTGTGSGYYQCVEYVKRFYRDAIGHDTSGWRRNGNEYYGTANAKGLEAYPNGRTVAPRADDILCFDDGDYGHVAIIMEVGSDYVKVIEQNWSRYTCYATLSLTSSGGTYTMPNRSGYAVQGWLRAYPKNQKML
jgi:surface antigen